MSYTCSTNCTQPQKDVNVEIVTLMLIIHALKYSECDNQSRKHITLITSGSLVMFAIVRFLFSHSTVTSTAQQNCRRMHAAAIIAGEKEYYLTLCITREFYKLQLPAQHCYTICYVIRKRTMLLILFLASVNEKLDETG